MTTPGLIDIDGLQREIADARIVFDKWVTDNIQAALDLKAKHQNMAREARATVQALQEREKRLESEVSALKMQQARDKTEVADLEQQLAVKMAEVEEIPRRLQELQAMVDEEEQRTRNEAQQVDVQMAQVRRELESVQTKIRMIEESLGLRIEQSISDNRLRFLLNRLDPTAPERLFTFDVRVTNDGYVVPTCSPDLPELPTLLATLNENPNEFFRFVRSMRQAFKAALRR